MNNPYISIIVPIYKVENYIRECVDSIICQKGDWELILVDDGSRMVVPQYVMSMQRKMSVCA